MKISIIKDPIFYLILYILIGVIGTICIHNIPDNHLKITVWFIFMVIYVIVGMTVWGILVLTDDLY